MRHIASVKLDRITYKITNPDRLVIQIFNPWHGIIPVFLALASALAMLQTVLQGQFVFALFLLVIVIAIAFVVIRFLGLRRVDFDRNAGIIRLSNHFPMRSEQRKVQLSEVARLLFT